MVPGASLTDLLFAQIKHDDRAGRVREPPAESEPVWVARERDLTRGLRAQEERLNGSCGPSRIAGGIAATAGGSSSAGAAGTTGGRAAGAMIGDAEYKR